jgi:hypothetical protein
MSTLPLSQDGQTFEVRCIEKFLHSRHIICAVSCTSADILFAHHGHQPLMTGLLSFRHSLRHCSGVLDRCLSELGKVCLVSGNSDFLETPRTDHAGMIVARFAMTYYYDFKSSEGSRAFIVRRSMVHMFSRLRAEKSWQ